MSVAYAVAALALLLRRYRPLAVTGAVTGVLGLLFLTAGASDGLGSLLPPLIAFYSAGRHGPVPELPAAAALTAAGVVLHERFDPRYAFDGRAVTIWCAVAAAGAVGHLLGRRATQLDRALRETRRLESARDDELRAAATAEREHLARELHDLVGHGMSVAVLQIAAVQATLDAGDVAAARARLAQAERTSRETLDEVRRLVTVTAADGDTPLAPQPGLSDLEGLVRDLREAGADVSLNIDVRQQVPAGIGLTTYRVVQEALTNVVRHARASAHVLVAEHAGGLLVEVLDDGDQRPRQLSGGSGVSGMRRRVGLYGGRFDIAPRSEGGVRVTAWLPLPAVS